MKSVACARQRNAFLTIWSQSRYLMLSSNGFWYKFAGASCFAPNGVVFPQAGHNSAHIGAMLPGSRDT